MPIAATHTKASLPTTLATSAGHMQECRDWQRVLYDNNWAGITWPKQYGGRGAKRYSGRNLCRRDVRNLMSRLERLQYQLAWLGQP